MINVRRLTCLGLSFAAFVLVCACDKGFVTPSGPHTITGVITQMTSSGKVPIRRASVQETKTHRQAYTDDNGRYRLAALPAGATTVEVSMLRFQSASRSADVGGGAGDTIVDVELLPREDFTLSGFVTEETPAGLVPVAGVLVQAVECAPPPPGYHRFVEAETDSNGFYSVSGMCDGVTTLYARKTGYELPPPGDRPCDDHGEACRWITITGNTRFDFQLNRK
jgi:hypothetical protein